MRATTETAIRRGLNLVLYLNVCFLAGTGLLMDWRLPPGNEGGRGLRVLGMSRHEWGDWHVWGGYVFLFLLLAHLWLARKWLQNVAARKKAGPLFLGLFLGVILILFFLFLPVESTRR